MISALDISSLQKTRQDSEYPDELEDILKQLSLSADDNAIDRVIALYEKTLVTLEQEIWQNKVTKEIIEQYQKAFAVLEKLHDLKTTDSRYSFKIVIPVADRPQHLKQCLDSLLTLCKVYGYGGRDDLHFKKISVLIADDSREKNNIDLHKSYCEALSAQGLNTSYFGLEEQLELAKEMSSKNGDLNRIISDTDNINDVTAFSHKGASIMRNITYLKLNRMLPQGKDDSDTLIYFIDSDQEFCINIPDYDENLYAINYFHYLNTIFKTQDVSILTGKVVGDPPVSPSVMAGNFQQDILNFLNKAGLSDPEQACQFHQHESDSPDDAAYHDMANLFGFASHEQAFDYHCTIKGEHNNGECYSGFSEKLRRFFYGEHPTRKTFFHYENGFSAAAPARTVYTGNYVIKPENLDYFIPFATLKLRMAGPVLGRLLNTKLHGKFVSANLPMLHKRTVESIGQSEFRAGVQNINSKIDLSSEFVRQFYGDIMLFSIKKISEQETAMDKSNSDDIRSIVEHTYNEIKQNYVDKRCTVLDLKSQIQSQLNDDGNWWQKSSEQMLNIEHANNNFGVFLENIQSNFDESGHAYQQISSPVHSEKHLDAIIHAILYYQNDLQTWKKTLDS